MSAPTAPAVAGGGDRTLWCVHVLGSDDVYAAPDVVTAARWATALNYACYHLNQDVTDDDYVICHANVERWHGTAEDHAAYLAQSTELCTPKRGVIPPGQVVEIDYTNHEGRRSVRKVKPTGRMLVGLDHWHSDAPWVIEARDIERGVMRTFDPAKIHRWGAALSPPAGAGAAGLDEVEATPGAKWRVEGKPDPHGDRYDCERAKLALGNMTDDELANAVFMHGNQRLSIEDMLAGKPSSMAYLTAAKDRIRWLSRQLEAATLARQAADLERLRAAEVPAGLRKHRAEAARHVVEIVRDYVPFEDSHRYPAMTDLRTLLPFIEAVVALDAPDRGSEVRPEGGGEGGADHG